MFKGRGARAGLRGPPLIHTYVVTAVRTSNLTNHKTSRMFTGLCCGLLSLDGMNPDSVMALSSPPCLTNPMFSQCYLTTCYSKLDIIFKNLPGMLYRFGRLSVVEATVEASSLWCRHKWESYSIRFTLQW
jgi:hypothetical protein